MAEERKTTISSLAMLALPLSLTREEVARIGCSAENAPSRFQQLDIDCDIRFGGCSMRYTSPSGWSRLVDIGHTKLQYDAKPLKLEVDSDQNGFHPSWAARDVFIEYRERGCTKKRLQHLVDKFTDAISAKSAAVTFKFLESLEGDWHRFQVSANDPSKTLVILDPFPHNCGLELRVWQAKCD